MIRPTYVFIVLNGRRFVSVNKFHSGISASEAIHVVHNTYITNLNWIAANHPAVKNWNDASACSPQ
jgi:hypothetical protein